MTAALDARVFTAPAADALILAELAPFTAVFHRASGVTHLLVDPAPQIVAALAGTGLTRRELAARLAERFEIGDPDEAALAARLDELVVAGLVRAA